MLGDQGLLHKYLIVIFPARFSTKRNIGWRCQGETVRNEASNKIKGEVFMPTFFQP